VSILGSLDDKIEHNRRTAQALERLARAIFKAWFVDFEPVKAKAEGATSFPSMPQDVFDALPTTFVDTEIGPVPERWGVKAATDVATVAIGKTPPRKERHWFTENPANVPWVSIKDMGQAGMFIGNSSEYLLPEAVERYRVRRIPDGSVLLSFKLTLGRVAIADGEITSNEAIAHFIPKERDAVGSEYLYCYLSSFDYARLGSTSSIATATNSKVIRAMPVIVPPREVAASFTESTSPFFRLTRALGRQSAEIAKLRDYLLPRLMSRQIAERHEIY
jgi:type I restriction enzyme, S subunit